MSLLGSQSAASTKCSSRRKRLWEITHKHHCHLVGVCFEVNELRRLISRLVKVPNLISDFELHRSTVQACASRCSVSEFLHKALEKRYSLSIAQFRELRTQTELAIRWRTAVCSGDVANVLWAILSHPQCDEGLEDAIYGELHMLQHQVGSARRHEHLALHTLQRENSTLLRELASAQQRTSAARDQRVNEISQLRHEVAALQSERSGLQARLAALQEAVNHAQQDFPDIQDRERLAKRAKTAEAQCVALRAQLRTHEAQAEHWQRQYLRLNTERVRDAALPSPAPAALNDHNTRCQNKTACQLSGKQVLCIGGRPGVIGFYRQLVEDQGGHFSHHDGGMEENLAQLEPSLAAADAVICQTGCINHNAYWRVKDFCKRTGKPCIFVKTPGISSFQRGLEQLTEAEIV